MSQAILVEEDRVVCIRFGHDHDPDCMAMDETLYGVSEKVQNFAVIYLGESLSPLPSSSLPPAPSRLESSSLSRIDRDPLLRCPETDVQWTSPKCRISTRSAIFAVFDRKLTSRCTSYTTLARSCSSTGESHTDV